MIILFHLIIFFIGACFGSFLNCLIYRLAEHQPITGRSFCPRCRKLIAWYDNIPVASFFLLKGKCRQCREKISWQYPIVEILMGFLFLLPVVGLFLSRKEFLVLGGQNFFSDILEILRVWIVYFILTFIFVYDLKYMAIEDVVLLPSIGLVIMLNLFTSPLVDFLAGLGWEAKLGHMILAVLLAVVFFGGQYVLTKGKGIGLGDLRIGLFMAVALGHWSALFLALVVSYLLGAIISLFLLVLKKRGLKSEIPLGPFLSLGTFFTFLFGQGVINWFLRSSFR